MVLRTISFTSAAERSAAAGVLQEVKRQETGGDPKTLRPRRRRHLTREYGVGSRVYGAWIAKRGLGKLPQIQPPKSSPDRKSKEVAKPLPLLLSPASTPPVRRPRQRPLLDQWTRRTSATPISHLAPSAARLNVICFGSRAQRCRGLLTGGEESGDRRRPRDASPPTSPGSDEGVGCKE